MAQTTSPWGSSPRRFMLLISVSSQIQTAYNCIVLLNNVGSKCGIRRKSCRLGLPLINLIIFTTFSWFKNFSLSLDKKHGLKIKQIHIFLFVIKVKNQFHACCAHCMHVYIYNVFKTHTTNILQIFCIDTHKLNIIQRMWVYRKSNVQGLFRLRNSYLGVIAGFQWQCLVRKEDKVFRSTENQT